MYVRRITLERIGEESIIVLTNLLRGVWSDQWEKSPPKKNYKPTAKTHKVAGGHSSAWKLLEKGTQKEAARRAREQMKDVYSSAVALP